MVVATPRVYSPLNIGTSPQEVGELKEKTVNELQVSNTSANTIYFAFGKSNWFTVTTGEIVKIGCGAGDGFFISDFWVYASTANSSCEIIALELGGPE